MGFILLLHVIPSEPKGKKRLLWVRGFQFKSSLLKMKLTIAFYVIFLLTWWRAPGFANQSVSQQLAGLYQPIVNHMAGIKSCSLWILHKTVAKQQTLHYKQMYKLDSWRTKRATTAATVTSKLKKKKKSTTLKYCVQIRERRHWKDACVKSACVFY